MLWEKPTSASWWTFTVSHTVVISLCSISCGPLHSLRSRVRGIKHTVVVFLFLRVAFPLLVLLHYYSLSLSISVSSRSNPAGGATAKNSRCWLWCDPQLQMGWKPSAHTHLVQKGFKHGKKRPRFAHFPLYLCSHCFYRSHFLPKCLQKRPVIEKHYVIFSNTIFYIYNLHETRFWFVVYSNMIPI